MKLNNLNTLMKKLINSLLLVIIAFTFIMPANVSSAVNNVPQEKKKKEKKPKKERPPFEWADVRPDKLSGVKEMDEYILYCDTIWDRVQTYKDEITFFKLDTAWALDGNDTIKVVRISDQDGVPRNFSHSMKQIMETTLTGTNLLLDVTLISLMTTNASLSMASNPLLVFGYTKCIKGGPQIVKLAYGEVKETVDLYKTQSAEIKKIKESQLEGSTDQAIILSREDGEIPDFENLQNLDEMDLGSNEDVLDWDILDNMEFPDELPDEPDMNEKKV